MTLDAPPCLRGEVAHDWNYGRAAQWCGRCWLAIPYRRQRLRAVPNAGAKSIRQQVIERDGYRCRYCGTDVFPDRSQTDNARLTLDHVIPVFHHGLSTVENLVVACVACNSRKGNLTLDDWLAVAGFQIRNHWRTSGAEA